MNGLPALLWSRAYHFQGGGVTCERTAVTNGGRSIERYNRTYRTEVLNAYVFESLEQVREISAEWLQSYNEERPHDALAGLPPATYRAQLETRSSPVAVSR